jgi:hypothetical protein
MRRLACIHRLHGLFVAVAEDRARQLTQQLIRMGAEATQKLLRVASSDENEISLVIGGRRAQGVADGQIRYHEGKTGSGLLLIVSNFVLSHSLQEPSGASIHHETPWRTTANAWALL